MKYAAYIEDGCWIGVSDDPWSLIDTCIFEYGNDDALSDLRVGQCYKHDVKNYLFKSDIERLHNNNQLSLDNIKQAIIDRGSVGLCSDDAEQLEVSFCTNDPLPTELPDIIEWVGRNAKLSSEFICYNGRYPLPIAYCEGEWRFGASNTESLVSIDYQAPEHYEDEGRWFWSTQATGKPNESYESLESCMDDANKWIEDNL